ncbi:MAG TPA: DUF2141 domain-containing protein [Candidatus Binataceae bacterium]|nr:DUF2141 domain-containing protein [Candidatus Binataceae bacterium]
MAQAFSLCIRVGRIALIVVIARLSCATIVRADETPSQLQVAVVGLRNDKGQVTCSLFNDPKAFPRGDEFRETHSPIHGDAALCIFQGIPAGKYAVVVYHDENVNGHFDQNAFGMPLEGYGFSNNAAPLFDAPKFAAASFDYDGQFRFTEINIRY